MFQRVENDGSDRMFEIELCLPEYFNHRKKEDLKQVNDRRI